MKFLSNFTKQEIIEAIFKTIPGRNIEDIMLELYEVKSNRLLDEAGRLNDQLENTVGTLDFFVNMEKNDKKQREIDQLYNDFRKIIDHSGSRL